MITDNFALLDEPRRPWLNADALKAKFLALSAEVHPDRVHQAGEAEKIAANHRYTELNAAYNCLREPKDRLRHLLELELGRKPSDLTNIPDSLMNIFSAVGKQLREADAFLAEKQQTSSPLLQVQFFERGQERLEQLTALRQSITTCRNELLTNLKTLDAAWADTDAKPIERLLEIWRLLSFYERWLAQIQERIVRLSF